jgi:hypothetical protein
MTELMEHPLAEMDTNGGKMEAWPEEMQAWQKETTVAVDVFKERLHQMNSRDS